MKNKKRTLVFLLTVVMLLTCMAPRSPVYAEKQAIDLIELNYSANCTITNAEGEYFTYKDMKTTGTMPVLDITPPAPGGGRTVYIRVNSSTGYTYTNHTKRDIYFSVLGSYTFGIIEAKNCEEASISTIDGVRHLTVEGKNIEYIIDTIANNNGYNGIAIHGKANKKVEVQDTKEGILIKGAKGSCLLEADDMKDKKNSVRKIAFVPVAEEVLINLPSKGAIQLKGAAKVHRETTKKFASLHVVAPQSTTAFLTWKKLKGAKGYHVYKYNPTSKTYKKVKTCKGKNTNYYIDKNLEKGKAYKYKVQPYTHEKGKTVLLKRSYSVKAIVGSDTKGNASKVVLNKKGTVKKKVGKTLKLKATVSVNAGKTLYSNKVRWYSSNKKIATVDKNGKLKFEKKGSCYVWAKTHNGFNSKRLKVVVK